MEIGTISDTGRHGDDRFVDEAADDAGQSPFHAGDDDIYVGPADIIDAGQEAVDAGDADVVDAFNAVAHDFRRQGRFFGNGDIARPGGNDRNEAVAIDDGFVLMLIDHTGQFIILGSRMRPARLS